VYDINQMILYKTDDMSGPVAALIVSTRITTNEFVRDGAVLNEEEVQVFRVRTVDGDELDLTREDIIAELDERNVETGYRLMLMRYYNLARQAEITGDFTVDVHAYGSLNAGTIKITTSVEVGSWDHRGVFKSQSLNISYSHAATRFFENQRHDVKMISAS